jgi:hypothetical protein
MVLQGPDAQAELAYAQAQFRYAHAELPYACHVEFLSRSAISGFFPIDGI